MVKTKLKIKKASIDKQIDEILEYFNFEHVARFMASPLARPVYDDEGNTIGYEPWEIYSKNGQEIRVPTESELKEFAKDLLERVENNETIHCGPFKARRRNNILSLECVIESWTYGN